MQTWSVETKKRLKLNFFISWNHDIFWTLSKYGTSKQFLRAKSKSVYIWFIHQKGYYIVIYVTFIWNKEDIALLHPEKRKVDFNKTPLFHSFSFLATVFLSFNWEKVSSLSFNFPWSYLSIFGIAFCHHQLCYMTLPKNRFWSVNCIPKLTISDDIIFCLHFETRYWSYFTGFSFKPYIKNEVSGDFTRY